MDEISKYTIKIFDLTTDPKFNKLKEAIRDNVDESYVSVWIPEDKLVDIEKVFDIINLEEYFPEELKLLNKIRKTHDYVLVS